MTFSRERRVYLLIWFFSVMFLDNSNIVLVILSQPRMLKPDSNTADPGTH